MRIIKFRYSLQFYDNLTITNKIGSICLLQWLVLVRDNEFFLTLVRNTTKLEFTFECLLIDCLQEAVTKVIVDFHGSTIDGVRLVTVD